MPTSQDKKTPSPQLSKEAIRERIRPHALKAIATAVDLMENADNDSVRLGAAKLILAKILPDLKAQELTGKDGGELPFTITIQTTQSD